ncbi:MAG: hypothetical protein JWP30_6 [Homoserinimonas sp.]|jgi:hypothetical protein|nr:hypothetical protein [Homoserinimonas sp.]
MSDYGPDFDTQVVAGIREVIARAIDQLESADARDEALARFVPRRTVLGLFTREPTMIACGRVWRLGVFLLAPDGTLYQTGVTTRAVEPGYPGYQSRSAEERRLYRAAALKAGYKRGETVNLGAKPIALDASALRRSASPLVLRGDTAMVHWNMSAADASAVEFGAYLSERVSLLVHPPESA